MSAAFCWCFGIFLQQECSHQLADCPAVFGFVGVVMVMWFVDSACLLLVGYARLRCASLRRGGRGGGATVWDGS